MGLLNDIYQQSPATFAAILQQLHADKHTGPVVIHFAQGQPNTVELPCEPVRIKVEKRAPRAHIPAVQLSDGRVVNAISLATIAPERLTSGDYAVTVFAGTEPQYLRALQAAGISAIAVTTRLPTKPVDKLEQKP